ncbi:hypothetical protein LCGC14_0880740 [marine sediment metagenome]|uniref:Uncharacterized protein n=1 Tax=marine sediment metagenome TaxID=412755 RepID=A0A0F9PMN4_9ZZZZ|nr:hypothetical protein [Candidatus Scalindua sp.]
MRKPIAPAAPRKPSKPSKPLKVLTYNEEVCLKLYPHSGKLTFVELLKKVPEGVDYKDIYLVMENDYNYCDNCYCGNDSVHAYYPKEVENRQYDTQMEAHVKKMVKYNEKLEGFKLQLGEWEIKNAKYLEKLDEWTAENTERNQKA